MSCWCDYDPPEFWTRKTRRAAKSHKCEECFGVIAVGEKYEHVSGKWEGWLSTHKTCLRCVGLRQWVTNNLPCFCWAHGNLFEDAREAASEAAYRAGDEAKGIRFGVARRIVQIRRHNSLARAA